MTDGIIQEVFKRLLQYDYDSFLRVDVELLQQELIEKIKQKAISEFPKDTPIEDLWIECPLEDLIGDNQE